MSTNVYQSVTTTINQHSRNSMKHSFHCSLLNNCWITPIHVTRIVVFFCLSIISREICVSTVELMVEVKRAVWWMVGCSAQLIHFHWLCSFRYTLQEPWSQPWSQDFCDHGSWSVDRKLHSQWKWNDFLFSFSWLNFVPSKRYSTFYCVVFNSCCLGGASQH